MDSEWRTDVTPGYRTKVIRVGNVTVEINKPILSEEEQRKRERQVEDALTHFWKGVQTNG